MPAILAELLAAGVGTDEGAKGDCGTAARVDAAGAQELPGNLVPSVAAGPAREAEDTLGRHRRSVRTCRPWLCKVSSTPALLACSESLGAPACGLNHSISAKAAPFLLYTLTTRAR